MTQSPLNTPRQESLNRIIVALEANDTAAAEKHIWMHRAQYENDPDLPTLEATLALAALEWAQAMRILQRAVLAHPGHFGSLLMLGNLYRQLERFDAAAALYSRAHAVGEAAQQAYIESLWPSLAAQGIAERPPVRKLAVLVVEGDENGLDPLLEAFTPYYAVRLFICQELDDLDAARDWADICWFEGLTGLLEEATAQPTGTPIVCRMLGDEAFTGAPLNITWDAVDHLIVKHEHQRDMLAQMIPGLGMLTKVHVLPDGIDMQRFTLREHQNGYQIATVGPVYGHSNPMMLLHIMGTLIRLNPAYQLHVAGTFHDPSLRLYWQNTVQRLGLTNNVHLHGPQDDLDAWLADKDYLLCTSIHERTGAAVAEAMACGIKPVVHFHPFADRIWPEEMLFDTIEGAVQMITNDDYQSHVYHSFVSRMYGLDGLIGKLRPVLDRAFAAAEAAATASAAPASHAPVLPQGFAQALQNLRAGVQRDAQQGTMQQGTMQQTASLSLPQ